MKPASPKRSAPALNESASKPSREDILKAALACFSVRGYDGTSIADVARASGVSHPLVHYHFRNKELLWKAMVEHAFGGLASMFEVVRLAAADLDPISALRVSLKNFARFCVQNPQHIDLLLIEGRAHTPRFTEIISTYLKPMHDLTDGLILKAIDQGTIRPVPPVHLANMMVGAIAQFATARGVIEQLYNTDPLDHDAIMKHAEVVLDVALHGVMIAPEGK